EIIRKDDGQQVWSKMASLPQGIPLPADSGTWEHSLSDDRLHLVYAKPDDPATTERLMTVLDVPSSFLVDVTCGKPMKKKGILWAYMAHAVHCTFWVGCI